MSDKVDFKRRINDLVDRLDHKRSDIPRLIGISYSTFTKTVNYGAIPQIKTLIKIADFFGISVEYLLAKTDDEYFDKSPTPKTFFERFDELRNEKGLTYHALSKEIYLESSYFAEWKKFGHIPNLDNLITVATYFKVSIDYLLGRTDDR